MESKKKILIADDSKTLSDLMKEMLEFKGYETHVVHDGEEALATALKEHPDLILLDLRMPKLDGYEVVRKLRNDNWGKTAKILILTATGQIGDIPNDLGIKGTDYMEKSIWGIEDVEQRIRKKLTEID